MTERRIAPAEGAVRAALDWYLDVVPRIKKPAVSHPQAEHLRAVLTGDEPLADQDFESLVNFARSMYSVGQVDPHTPRVNLGDVLTAIALVPEQGATPWTFDTNVDADAFAKLQFRETSAGLGETRRKNRDGWQTHALKNRAFIEEVVDKTQRRNVAVVLGAGHAFDLPLVKLAGAFEKLVLVDIDGEALNATVRGTLKDRA